MPTNTNKTYVRAEVMDLNRSNTRLDTKSQIFNTSLRLFAVGGYENVSIRTIADAVGIKTASIYYHYSNKEQILEACYNFYVEHCHATRLNKDQYGPIVRQGTKEGILKILNYSFPGSIMENMILSLRVIFSRIYTDVKAKEIYMDEINCSMQYLTEFFNFGIEIGRFHEFNVSAVALIFLSSRLFVAQSVTMNSDQKAEWHKAELEVFDELINILPFIY